MHTTGLSLWSASVLAIMEIGFFEKDITNTVSHVGTFQDAGNRVNLEAKGSLDAEDKVSLEAKGFLGDVSGICD